MAQRIGRFRGAGAPVLERLGRAAARRRRARATGRRARLERGRRTGGRSWPSGGAAPSDATTCSTASTRQARGWFAQMQQLAAQFAGQDTSAADIAGAWKQARRAATTRSPTMFNGMQGPGQHGFEQWFEQVAPLPAGAGSSGGKGLAGPAGVRLRPRAPGALAAAGAGAARLPGTEQGLQGADGRSRQAGVRALRGQAGRTQRAGPADRQSARALFDLWIDAAEEAYAEIALSPQFREVYGEFVNSQMRVRAGAAARDRASAAACSACRPAPRSMRRTARSCSWNANCAACAMRCERGRAGSVAPRRAPSPPAAAEARRKPARSKPGRDSAKRARPSR